MELFKLLGTISVNSSDANTAIDETSEKAGGFSEKLKSGIGTAAKWGTAIVGGATVAAGAMVKFAESSASTADNVDKMSQKIGISREAYQELDFICSQSGMSVDTLQGGLKTMTKVMKTTADGTSKTKTALEELGISATNADGTMRSQEEVMWESISALQNMEDQTKKAAIASTLFGRAGTEMMPLLNGASGSIEEMKQQAHDLGLVLSDELIDNGVELTDSLDQTKRAFSAIATNLGGSLMPIVTQASDYVQKALPYIQQLVERLSPILTSMLEGLLPPLMDLCEQIFPVLFDLIEQLLPPIIEIVQAILPVIVELLQVLLPPIMELVKALLPVIVKLVNALIPILKPIIELLKPILDLAIALLKPLLQLINLILPPIAKLIAVVANKISSVLKPVIETISTIIEKVFVQGLTNAKNIVSNVVGGIVSVWTNLKNKTKSIFNSVKEFMTNPIEKAKELIKGIIDKIKGFFHFKFELPKIKLPHFAVKPKGWKIADLLKGSIPKLGIDWYAKAMDNPMLMTKPTAFGVNANGQIMAGGEKGAEVVSGANTLMNMISESVAEQNSGIIEAINKILDLLAEYIPDMANMNVVMDSGALVGTLTPAIDKQLGTTMKLKARGV